MAFALAAGLAGIAPGAPARAEPQGGEVVAGSATINVGPASVITQTSDRAIIDWQGFSIGAGESVNFVQPGAQSITLNRVVGGDLSAIYGSLTANGRLVLVNPRGILFGEGAKVDVGGLVATTADISNENFMAGHFIFDRPGAPGASIVNEGEITARDAGIVAFVAPHLRNSGIITANLGSVTLAGGTKFTLDLYGDDLVSFALDADIYDVAKNADGSPVAALVESNGSILAEGGRIVLTARAARSVIDNVILAEGTLAANSVRAEGGAIILDGGSFGGVVAAGEFDASGASGGTIDLKGERVLADGVFNADAASSLGGGGRVRTGLSAPSVLRREDAKRFDAEPRNTEIVEGRSGAGGEIRIEGSAWVSLGGALSANGAEGGKIIVDAGGLSLAGALSATGESGAGGAIEIASARAALVFSSALVDASGATGGSIRQTAGTQITSSGNYFAYGASGEGGSIDMTAPVVKLLSAKFDASGASDGGRVRIGGEFQGGHDLAVDELLNARTLVATSGTEINVASRGSSGRGGSAILWSDVETIFLGDVDARPGLSSGAGGFAEISSGGTLTYNGSVLASLGGRAGEVLLDPKDIVIVDGSTFNQLSLILGYNYAGSPDEISGNGRLGEGDGFGAGVSLDGNRLAVGATDDGGAFDASTATGAVYLFSFADSLFNGGALEAVIGKGYTGGKNIDVAAIEDNDFFGWSVALDGNRLAVGAIGDDGAGNVLYDPFCDCGNASGAVYLFDFADLSFNSGALQGIVGYGYTGGKNIDVANIDLDDSFGSAVSLDGNRLAVGARYDDGNAFSETFVNDAGAVYLFSFGAADFTGGVLEAIGGAGYFGGKDFDVGNLEADDWFGRSVSLDGDRLAVGAYKDDGFGNPLTNSGAAYLFTFADSAFNGANLEGIIGSGYTGGKNYDLSQLQSLDNFGSGISLDGNRLAVGAFGDAGAANVASYRGAAYLFSFSDSSFSGATLEATVGDGYTGGKNVDVGPLDSTGFEGDLFGIGVSLDGNRLVVGAPSGDGLNNGLTDSGEVYLITFTDSAFNGGALAGRIGAGYSQNRNLDIGFALDSADFFGSSVSLDGLRLAVGAFSDDGATDALAGSGAVRLFTFSDLSYSNPQLVATIGSGYTGGRNINVSQLSNSDSFGQSVSLDGNRLAVGAPGDDGIGIGETFAPNSGAAYLFSFGAADFSGGALEAVIRLDVFAGGDNYNLAALEAFDQFGTSVSLDGNRLAVGAPGDDGVSNGASDAGAAYLFTFADSAFSGTALAGTFGAGYSGGNNLGVAGLEATDSFGYSVSLNGLGLAVGAELDDGAGNALGDSGSVRLFTFSDLSFASPTLRATIGAGYTGGSNVIVPTLQANDIFGASVSLDGLRLAVGAPFEDGVGDLCGSCGAVFLFDFANASYSGGALRATYGSVFSSGANFNLALDPGDNFGLGVSLDGLRLAVGAGSADGVGNALTQSGEVYLFTYTDTAFNGAYLAGRIGQGYAGPADFDIGPAIASGDGFAESVSLDGNRLAVGVLADSGAGGGIAFNARIGAIQLYSFTDEVFSSPVLEAIIGLGYTGGKNVNVTDLVINELFGASVSLDGNRLAVGSEEDLFRRGNVRLFTFTDPLFSGGALAATIGNGYTGPNDINLSQIGFSDFFGWGGVSLDGNRLAVGAPGDDGAGNLITNSGAVYLFSFAGPSFTGGVLEGTIGAGYTGAGDFDFSALATNDALGFGVSLDGNRLALGAPDYNVDSGAYSGPGAVYLFSFVDAAFNGAALEAAVGPGQTGGKNIDVSGVDTGESFGSAVALDGLSLAIGARFDAGASNTLDRRGAVRIFSFEDLAFNGGALDLTIGSGYAGARDIDPTLGNLDLFAASVSLDGGRLAVGASGDDGFNNTIGDAGAVYLFNLLADPADLSFGFNPSGTSYVSIQSIQNLLSSGNALTLQASNDITLGADIIVNNPVGDGGDFTLRAGRSILLNADIVTDNGDFLAVANDTAANGVNDAERDPGTASIIQDQSTTIDVGLGEATLRLSDGADRSNNAAGNVVLGTIFGASVYSQNFGPGNIVLNGEIAVSSTATIILAAVNGNFINNFGPNALDPGPSRFIIYSQNPSNNVFGGLTAANWYNTAFGGPIPSSGNLFVYTLAPTLTVAANNFTITAGDPLPAFTASISGFLPGDNPAGTTGSPAFSNSGGAAPPPGTFSITPSQGTLASANNYGFAFTGGTLTVNAAPSTTPPPTEPPPQMTPPPPEILGQISNDPGETTDNSNEQNQSEDESESEDTLFSNVETGGGTGGGGPVYNDIVSGNTRATMNGAVLINDPNAGSQVDIYAPADRYRTQIDWDAAGDAVDRQNAAGVSPPLPDDMSGIDAANLPVLLALNADPLSVQVHSAGDTYFASYTAGGVKFGIYGSRVLSSFNGSENPEPVVLDYVQTEYGVSVNVSVYGAVYQISMYCHEDHTGMTLADHDLSALQMAVKQLAVVIGKSGEGQP